MYRSGVNNSTKKSNLAGLLVTQKLQLKIMTTLTQSTQTQSTQPTQDKHTAAFDVFLSLPPANTSLDSEYFQAYLREVIKSGNTPF